MTWQMKLLAWYRRRRRDLPWRRTKDPYAVWISEIMLQQTTVQAVIPYYERFLDRFPTVTDLARAEEEEVLKLWSGLGYYSRARNLHKAARIVRDGDGKVPGTVAELMKLPGIGRYTAGAVASIAFDVRAPIVDGNVIRVLSRLFAIAKEPKSKEGQKVFWKKAEEILPSRSFGDFNQALMELGATVCVPENPGCLLCPVQAGCAARKKGRPADFPKGTRKTEYREVELSAAVIREPSTGRLLMVRRPEKGLLKGFWEFPMAEGDAASLGNRWPVRVLRSLAPVRHSVLNRRLKIIPHLCLWRGQAPNNDKEGAWIHPNDFKSLATSSMNRKILRQLEASAPTITERLCRDSSKRSSGSSA